MIDKSRNPETKTDNSDNSSEVIDPIASDETKKPRRRLKRFVWTFLIILVMLFALTTFAYWYLFMHAGKLNLSSFPELTKLRNTIEHRTNVAPHKSKPVATKPSGQENVQASPVPPNKAQATAEQHPLGTRQAAQLMTAIQGLQSQLQQMHHENEQLRSALEKQQSLDLRSRLRLIADPSTNLQQLALLWQDVSLSPVISADQRNQAISLTEAARDALNQNQQWKQHLSEWINKLSEPGSGPDLVPHFHQSWLEWLTSQFHLRPVPTHSNGNKELRQKLIQIRNGMKVESWPQTKDWRPIRAELVIIDASSAKNNGKSTALGLPSDFTAIRKAVTTLHETAVQWLGENS